MRGALARRQVHSRRDTAHGQLGDLIGAHASASVGAALLKIPGIDPVWLGVMMAVNLQTSYMHPPLGPTLFFLRGVAPPEVTMLHIFQAVVPYLFFSIAVLALVFVLPGTATWLPVCCARAARRDSSNSRVGLLQRV